MLSMAVIGFIIIFFVFWGVSEYARHQRYIREIPVRIHVNGTRGKSSVTRLIGVGLRAGGISTITKVTGTFPRLIMEDASEVKIHRKAGANILEQLAIVKLAAARRVQALVIECMALQPQYQWITENQMIHATMGVITNVRLDHVDVMGYTLPEIANCLGKTIPKNGRLYTTEYNILDILNEMAWRKKTEMIIVDRDTVTEEEMRGFSYIEHRDNVALALEICAKMGVDRQTALQGMYEAEPDAGVLRRFIVESFERRMSFYNAFAANDPESSLIIWNKLRDEIGFRGTRCILLNTRHDRLDRARQLAEMVGQKLRDEMDYLVLIGESTNVVASMATANGCPPSKILNPGWTTTDKVFEELISLARPESTIVAIGNMGGMGAQIADYFSAIAKLIIRDDGSLDRKRF